jgi:hypothetical protein
MTIDFFSACTDVVLDMEKAADLRYSSTAATQQTKPLTA